MLGLGQHLRLEPQEASPLMAVAVPKTAGTSARIPSSEHAAVKMAGAAVMRRTVSTRTVSWDMENAQVVRLPRAR
jgi:hypothetical protein